MSIKVKIFYPRLQKFINDQDVFEVDGATVGECLNDLVKRFPGAEACLFDRQGQLLRHVFVFVNLESAQKADLSERVKGTDELIIAVLIAGG